MKNMMDHIKKLAVEIGPRGSATSAEAEAVEYVTAKFTQYGLEAWRQPFKSLTTFSWLYFTYYLIPLCSILLAMARPVLAILIGLAGTFAFYSELNTRPVLERLFPKRDSLNAIGHRRIRESEQPEKTVVLMAHLDSSKAGLNFKPGMVENFRPSFLLMVASMVLTPILLVLYALTTLSFFWIVAWLPVIYLVMTAVLLVHREIWNRYTNGANDNASGVAVLLGLAEAAGQGAFSNLDLWFVATGSEEAGTYGSIEFLEKHGAVLKDAFIINVDNVGAGQVHYMAGEGMFPTHPADEDLLLYAEKVALAAPELNVTEGIYSLMSTDALPALVRGYKAMSFLATRDGLLPNWHWITDTYENVEEDTVRTCYLFISKMLELIAGEWKLGDLGETAADREDIRV